MAYDDFFIDNSARHFGRCISAISNNKAHAQNI
jgi:hypothetical protein